MSDDELSTENLRNYMVRRRLECDDAIRLFREEAIKAREAGEDYSHHLDRENIVATRRNLYAELIQAIDSGEFPK